MILDDTTAAAEAERHWAIAHRRIYSETLLHRPVESARLVTTYLR